MNGIEYQELAMRTNDGNSFNRMMKFASNEDGVVNTGSLLNGVLGLTGEAGEVSDLVKKCVFHEKEVDREHLAKELGDVMWYIVMICDACGFDLDGIVETNINKLKARYPEGFDVVKANNRESNDV